MNRTTLEDLLAEDGHRLKSSNTAWTTIRCFNPFHDDKNPSMRVNRGDGTYVCMSCGIKGNAYTYLTEIRKLDKKDAWDILEAAGWDKSRYRGLEKGRKEAKPAGAKLKWSYNPPKKLGDYAEWVATHDYLDADSTLIVRLYRYEQTKKTGRKPPKVLPYTPRTEGGFWHCGPLNEYLPQEDVRASKFPLYRLPELAQVPRNRQVWVVEGEKCADAVANCVDVKDPPPVTSLFGGTAQPFEKQDLTPLQGRRVLLMADADDKGRKYMRSLGGILIEKECEVRYLLPPGDSTDDVAKVIAHGGWQAVLKWAKEIGVKDHKEVATKIKEDNTIPPLTDTAYFRVLGYEKDWIIIQSRIHHRIMHINPRALTAETTLLTLAPLSFWKEISGGRTWNSLARQGQADAIIRAADALGFIDLSTRSYGRGLGMGLFNLGNKLLAPNSEGLLTVEKSLDRGGDTNIYVPGPPIKVLDDRQSEGWAVEFCQVVRRYRWLHDYHAKAFLGWLVTSIVGGDLRFRPQLWLTAPSKSGKTFLLNDIMHKFHAGMNFDMVNASEAGMAQALGSDSVPAYLDEFEPDPQRESAIKEVLALVRASTSGDGARVRGTAGGNVMVIRPRFSIFVVSIDRPKLKEADDNRFVHLQLGPPVKDWPQLRRDIERVMDPQRCLGIRTRIIRWASKIVESARAIEDKMLIRGDMPTREAQIMSALSAGYQHLTGTNEIIAIQRQPDDTKYPPLDLILSIKLRVVTGEDITLAEAIRRGFMRDGNFVAEGLRDNDARMYERIAIRHGWRMVGVSEMWISPTAPTMQGLLKKTAYQDINLQEYVSCLDGVWRPQTASGAWTRMMVGGVSRIVYILSERILNELGLIDSSPEDDY